MNNNESHPRKDIADDADNSDSENNNLPEEPRRSSNIPSYLQHNDWERELNFKLWVTKGARFSADKRCKTQAFWSQLSLNFLSGYLIMLGLLPLFLKTTTKSVSLDALSFAVACTSIVAMVWGLMESGKQYDLQAARFHACAVSIGKLYSRLRRAKQLPNDEKTVMLGEISEAYDDLLERYENHDPLDYDNFKIQKPDYFELTASDIRVIRMKTFICTRLIYLATIIIPFSLLAWMFSKEFK